MSQTIDAPAKRGRPPAEDPKGSSVTAWLPTRQHDRLIHEANRLGVSVSEYVRVTLARKMTGG